MWAAVRPTRGDDFGKFVTLSVPTCVYSTMWAAVRPTEGNDLGKFVTPSVHLRLQHDVGRRQAH